MAGTVGMVFSLSTRSRINSRSVGVMIGLETPLLSAAVRDNMRHGSKRKKQHGQELRRLATNLAGRLPSLHSPAWHPDAHLRVILQPIATCLLLTTFWALRGGGEHYDIHPSVLGTAFGGVIGCHGMVLRITGGGEPCGGKIVVGYE